MFGWYQALSLRWKLTLPLLLLVALVMYMGLHAMTTSKILGGNAVTIAKVNLPEIQLLIQADRDLYQAMLAERALLQLDSSKYKDLSAEQSENAKQALDRVYQSLDLSDTSTPAEREEFTRRYKAWQAQAADVINAAGLSDDASRATAQQKSYGSAAEAFENLRNYINELQEKRLAHVDQFTIEIDKNQSSSSTQL